MAIAVDATGMSVNAVAGGQRDESFMQRYGDSHMTVALTPTDWPIAHLVDATWQQYFADVPRANIIVAGYTLRGKTCLGRIRMLVDGSESEIALNTYLTHPHVPPEIPIGIIAHEIVHYAQGFASPLPRMQQHAHAHGAVSRELAQRGLHAHERLLQEWATSTWPQLYATEHDRYRKQQQRCVAKTAKACILAPVVVY